MIFHISLTKILDDLKVNKKVDSKNDNDGNFIEEIQTSMNSESEGFLG